VVEYALKRAELEGDARRLAITLDRPLYRPGETIWARVWDLTADTLDSAMEDDVFLTLLDARGVVVSKQRLAAKHCDHSDGCSEGQGERPGGMTAFDLTTSATGGVYTLKATVGEATIERPLVVAAFEEPRIRKELDLLRDAYGPGDEVVAALSVSASGSGPLVDHPVKVVVQVEGESLPVFEARTDDKGEALLRFNLPEEMRRPDAILTVLVEEHGWTEAISREVPVVLDEIQIEWFPEGGDLVVGLPTRVYLRALDPHGEPADVSGAVVNQDGQEVTRFATLHDGLGRIDLTPKRGHTYSVQLDTPAGATVAGSLPAAFADGCVLRSYDDLDGKNAKIRVGVHCSTARTVVVTGSLRGETLDTVAVEAGPSKPGVVHLKSRGVDKVQGVARVTILSEQLEPLAERLIYRHADRNLQIEVTPKRTEYGPRDEVVLTVKTTDPRGKAVAADLSLSVVDDRLLKHADDEHGNLLTQVHLAPWIQGKLEDPAWYFDPDEEDAHRGLDMVLGTHGWRHFERRLVSVAPAITRADLGTGPAQPVSSEEWIAPDAGEGARAKREEGQVGALDEADRLAPENGPGQIGAFVPAPQEAIEGPQAPAEGLVGGIGGLIGAKGGQIGSGGLGTRGSGLGGGGDVEGIGGGLPEAIGRADGVAMQARAVVEGLGGLGTKGVGRGAGSSAYGVVADRRNQAWAVPLEPVILGALDRNVIDGVIRRHLSSIRYCYQRELRQDPDIRGKLVVKLVIAKDGSVSTAQRKRSSLTSVAVERCVLSRFQRMRFPQPAGGGIVILSYPLAFSPDGDVGHLDSSASPRPNYTRVRTFAKPDYSNTAVPSTRTDFRSTVFWEPTLRTDSEGRGEVRFYLSDAVTTFRVTAEGIGNGHAGRLEQELHSTRPFALDMPLPTEVSFGDRLLLPVRVTSRRDEGLEVDLKTVIDHPLQPEDGTGSQQFALSAGDGVTTVVPITVPDTVGEASVSVSATANGLTDAVQRTLNVVPRGFPHRWSASGELNGRIAEEIVIDDALPGGTEAQLTLYTNSLASLMDGMESMIRIPSGCFEQTSSSNYPNILVLRHLDRTQDNPSLQVDRNLALRQGYTRLTSYQVGTGGFETFGRGPGKEALSAYGLLQFADMATVFPDVDPQMVNEDVRFLLKARDGSGGYALSGRSSHNWGGAPSHITDAFITWALVETGHLKAGPEISRSRSLVSQSQDPYALALSTLALLHVDSAAGLRAAGALARLQDEGGSFPGAQVSVVGSTGQSLLVETTSLAILALHRSGQHPAKVRNAAQWLSAQRQGQWGWGSTQATVLALKALDSLAAKGLAQQHGAAQVWVDGEQVGTVSWAGDESSGVSFDLGPYLTPGRHTIELYQTAGEPVPYAIDASWRRLTPQNAEDAPLQLQTTLSSERVDLGETVRMTAIVNNPGEQGVGSPIARLGLPAGVRVETWQLEALRDRGEIAFFETRPREVTLYWEGFAPGESRQIDLDLVTEVPGTFSARASSAYPYYTDEAKVWAAGGRLDIRP